ncbi:MAG: tetratricopeptide repeat protein [Planctomycetota bacterium]
MISGIRRRRVRRPSRGRQAHLHTWFHGRLDEAESRYRRILERQPDHAGATRLLGVLAQQRGRPERAAELIRKAIALDDANPAYHSNLGVALQVRTQYDAAMARYEQALRLEPDHVWARFNRSTLLLYTEQGLGDTLQFVRYAPLVADRVGSVLLECQEALVPLLSRCADLDRVVARGRSSRTLTGGRRSSRSRGSWERPPSRSRPTSPT